MIKQKKSYDVCREEFAFAVADAMNKLGLTIEGLFQFAGLKGGRQTYYGILRTGKALKSTVKKLKSYVNFEKVIIMM